jgi:hypothetical protein
MSSKNIYSAATEIATSSPKVLRELSGWILIPCRAELVSADNPQSLILVSQLQGLSKNCPTCCRDWAVFSAKMQCCIDWPVVWQHAAGTELICIVQTCWRMWDVCQYAATSDPFTVLSSHPIYCGPEERPADMPNGLSYNLLTCCRDCTIKCLPTLQG